MSSVIIIRQCGLCDELYDVGTFANMDAAGCPAYSTITCGETEIDVCPKCTHKIIYQKITKTD